MKQVAAMLFSLLALAPAHALDLDTYPEIEIFIAGFSEEHQYSPARLRALLAQARVRTDIVAAMERPKEALPWHEYRKIFLTEDRLRRGAEFWDRHATAIERASMHHGVAPEIIVAIIGIETQYGRNNGAYLALDALVTLWLHYPPRSEFFRREFEQLLLLARELDIDPATIKGSYAGALGIPQFIPSSYRRYAVDGNGDGRRDLFGNIDDVVGSVANFLRQHGWEPGEPVFDEVELRGTRYFWIERLGLKPALSVEALAEFGVLPRKSAPPERRAALVGLEGESGPVYRLGYANFLAITRYNRSKRYAMAVAELAQQLRLNHEGSR